MAESPKTAPQAAAQPAAKTPKMPRPVKQPAKAAAPAKAAKAAAAERAAPTGKTAKAGKQEKVKKPKMVRDSFTMPHDDYTTIESIKERCLKAGVAIKKSEVLRAALRNLVSLNDAALAKAVSGLEKIKTGRPSKS